MENVFKFAVRALGTQFERIQRNAARKLPRELAAVIRRLHLASVQNLEIQELSGEGEGKRKCVFCGQAANSREHVIPEWLSKRMGIREFEFHPAHFSEAHGLTVRPKIKCEYLKTKQVCKACNNGWMSQLEEWAQRSFGDYVEPSIPFDWLAGLLPIRREANQIVRWLLKTAIMVERALPRGTIEAVVPSLYPIAFGAEEPSDFHVWAAYIEQPNFNFHVLRGFSVWNGGVLEPYQIHASSMNFGLQLNHLALRLFRCPGAKAGLKSSFRVGGDFRAVPLWLTYRVSYPFPTIPAFPTFHDFMEALEVNASP